LVGGNLETLMLRLLLLTIFVTLPALATPDVEQVRTALLRADIYHDGRERILAGDFSAFEDTPDNYALWRLHDFSMFLDMLPEKERGAARENRELRQAFIAHITAVEAKTQEWGAKTAAEKFVQLHVLVQQCEAALKEGQCEGDIARQIKVLTEEMGRQQQLRRPYGNGETTFMGRNITAILESQKMAVYPMMLISHHFADFERNGNEHISSISLPRPSKSFNLPSRLVEIGKLECREVRLVSGGGRVQGTSNFCQAHLGAEPTP